MEKSYFSSLPLISMNSSFLFVNVLWFYIMLLKVIAKNCTPAIMLHLIQKGKTSERVGRRMMNGLTAPLRHWYSADSFSWCGSFQHNLQPAMLKTRPVTHWKCSGDGLSRERRHYNGLYILFIVSCYIRLKANVAAKVQVLMFCHRIFSFVPFQKHQFLRFFFLLELVWLDGVLGLHRPWPTPVLP